MLDKSLAYVFKSLFGVVVNAGRGIEYYFAENKCNDKNFTFNMVIAFRGNRKLELICHVEKGKVSIDNYKPFVETYSEIQALEKIFAPLYKNTLLLTFEEFIRISKIYLKNLAQHYI